MMNFKKIALAAFSLCSMMAFAQGPNSSGAYYKNANGLKGKALKTALYNIIGPHTNVGYDGLWNVYKDADKRSDGKVWDMYSSTTNFSFSAPHNYSKEGDGYNREHSVPQSWFSKASPMKSDAFHVVPTDGYINNMRGNDPYGEVNTNTSYKQSINGFSKSGTSKTPGYSGRVFEPNDQYKGDFARIYFYMATAYEGRAENWGGVFGTHDSYKPIQQWQMDMLMRWAKEDPVSQKEIDRNNAVFKHQKNRNPFVDYPGLEQFVWGDSIDIAFSYDKYQSGSTEEPIVEPDPVPNPDEPTVIPDNPDEPVTTNGNIYSKVTSITTGAAYILVCEESGMALSEMSDNTNFRKNVQVDIEADKVTTEVNANGKPSQLIIKASGSGYTFFDTASNKYLALSSDKNSLNSVDSPDDQAIWNITFNGGNAIITNSKFTNRSIQYNSSSPRFATYKTTSAQKPVQLYMLDTTTGISNTTTKYASSKDKVVYSIGGKRMGTANHFNSLKRGIYIINGKKVVKK